MAGDTEEQVTTLTSFCRQHCLYMPLAGIVQARAGSIGIVSERATLVCRSDLIDAGRALLDPDRYERNFR
jgi:hypothetical protein